MFLCPICKEPLKRDLNSLKCKNNHNFDISSKGYVNLLPVNSKNSLNPGDNMTMAKARHLFLSEGFYKKLSNNINEIANVYIKNGNKILDSGCSDAYYLIRLKDYLLNNKKICDFTGIDISKFAIQLAAKTAKDINFAVASIYSMPIPDNSIDFIISLFAPVCSEEFKRVLKSEGFVLVVTPSENHLEGLKKVIYKTPQFFPVDIPKMDGFKLLFSNNLNYEIEIKSNEYIDYLYKMTPYYYKSTQESKQIIDNLNILKTSVDFNIYLYRKE
jgi:23S rRNA (guanine745-N1)-methyltransferase